MGVRKFKDLQKENKMQKEQLQQYSADLKLRENRIQELEDENSRFLAELRRFQSKPMGSSEEVQNLKNDIKRKENYIGNLQAQLSHIEQKLSAARRECDGLRGDLKRQSQQYMHGPAPNTPVFKQPLQKKVMQISKRPPVPPPKAFPGKKTWSAAPKKTSTKPAPAVNRLSPRTNRPAVVPTTEKSV